MEAVRRVEGTAVPLDRSDVDTDQIVPAQFLKRIERTGFGPFLFHEWRKDPDFVLNDERYAGATILLAGANFGSGSSREHAPWALEEYGFRALIAPSFADIFFNNCMKNGVLPIVLDETVVDDLFVEVLATPGYELAVDLPEQTVTTPSGAVHRFSVDSFRKECMLNGWDDIGLTLRHADEIRAYEAERLKRQPWLAKSAG